MDPDAGWKATASSVHDGVEEKEVENKAAESSVVESDLPPEAVTESPECRSGVKSGSENAKERGRNGKAGDKWGAADKQLGVCEMLIDPPRRHKH